MGKISKNLFDVSLLKEALKQPLLVRFREACELYDFFERVTPFPYKPVLKSFSTFKDYEKWKKKQKDPRFW